MLLADSLAKIWVANPSPCGQYGSGNWCGAGGSPVAAKSVKCVGTELSLDECNSEAVDDACLSHARDAIIFCGLKSAEPFSDGELRLIGAAGAPSLAGEAGRLEIFLATSKTWALVCWAGFTSGAAAVACKQMGRSGSSGFAACKAQGACGHVRRRMGDECAGVVYVGWGLCVLCARRVCADDMCWARQSCGTACPLGASCCRRDLDIRRVEL